MVQKSAEQGDADAQDKLGLMYYNGQGVPKDYKEAVKWYTKAAEQGDDSARTTLGLCTTMEKVFRGRKEAVKWYRKAAEQENAIAQYNLGVRDGEGVPQDYKEAIKWFRKSPNRGMTC